MLNNIKERIVFISVLFLTVLISYYFPYYEEIYFILILVIFLFTRGDYFWFLFFFIIIQFPGALFAPPHGLIKGKGVIYFFIVATLIKGFLISEKRNVYLPVKTFNPVLLYSIFLLAVGAIISFDSDVARLIRMVMMSLVFLYTTQKLISDKIMFDKLIDLAFFSMIGIFIFQIYDIISPTKLLVFMGGSTKMANVNIDLNKGQLSRLFYAPLLSFFTLIFSLNYLLQQENKKYSKSFLILIVAISFLNIFLTATRGYTLQYIFIILAFSLLTGRKIFSIIIGLAGAYLILLQIFPILETQFSLVIERMFKLRGLMQGDLTAGGTVIRITERTPRVWEKFLEYPVFGVGYSKVGILYADDHVGNLALLLQGGIVGALIYIACLLQFLQILLRKIQRAGNNMAIKKKQIILFIAVIISMIIAHSTSSLVFGYYFQPDQAAQFALLFLFYKYEILQ